MVLAAPVELRIAQAIAGTEAEGPGRRFALWVQGCTLHCPGCCNPEMLAHGRGGELVTPEAIVERLRSATGLEGLTLLGGEPFEQAGALAIVAEQARGLGLSVMVFSGYTLAELRARPEPEIARLLAATDLLVDGRYEKDRPDTRRRWVGSANQQLHFLTDRYRPDDPRFAMGNTVELRLENGQLVVNGWPGSGDAIRR